MYKLNANIEVQITAAQHQAIWYEAKCYAGFNGSVPFANTTIKQILDKHTKMQFVQFRQEYQERKELGYSRRTEGGYMQIDAKFILDEVSTNCLDTSLALEQEDLINMICGAAINPKMIADKDLLLFLAFHAHSRAWIWDRKTLEPLPRHTLFILYDRVKYFQKK